MPRFPPAHEAAPVRPSRSRAALPADLRHIPWLSRLEEPALGRALADLRVITVEPGELLCRVGRPVTYWFGVIDGLLKVSNDAAAQMPITFAGLPPGGWFGEGTVLKNETYRYNVQALRRSVVAGIGAGTFHGLLDCSIGFNRFVMMQLNERLGQFIAAREIDRLTDPDERVARSLAALFHPVLCPGVGDLLRITQQELAYLVGLSRQRVNEALSALSAAGVIEIAYGGVRVLDLQRLRSWHSADGPRGMTPRVAPAPVPTARVREVLPLGSASAGTAGIAAVDPHALDPQRGHAGVITVVDDAEHQ